MRSFTMMNPADAKEAEESCMETEALKNKADMTVEVLRTLLIQVEKDWGALENRVLGHILRSPPIGLILIVGTNRRAKTSRSATSPLLWGK